MDNNCKIVQDILPLYIDDVCSQESRSVVEAHVSGCPECSAILEKLRYSVCETGLREEGNEVVLKHAKYEKRHSLLAGIICSGILMVPVLICLIVNLATGKGLTWFFLVLASLLVVASLTVVPLLVSRHKGLWMLAAFVASITILFATCCIYTRGHWFWITESATVFGLALAFLPAVVQAIKTGFWSRHKALLVIGADTLLLILMLAIIGLRVHKVSYWSTTAIVLVPVLVFVWSMLLITRYIKCNKRIRGGIATVWSGLFAASIENVIYMILGYTVVWHGFKPFTWTPATLSGNIHWFIFLICAIIGACLILSGAVRSCKTANAADTEE